MTPFAVPHYDLDFHHTSDGSDLEITNDEGDVIASFVGDKALKIFTLLIAFLTQSERDIYIESRIYHLQNTDFN
jgi:hypothetical protein